jgi:hypothetical protein
MKQILLLILPIFICSGVVLQGQEADSSGSLDDVVVKEKYEVNFEEEKLPVFIETDFSNIVEVPERLSWSVVNWNSPDGKQGNAFFEFRLSSPELTRIAPEPAKVFQVNFKNLSNWKLDIYASNGRIFRSLSGTGDPPRSIPWDGRGDSGQSLIPGDQYTYSFTAIDKAGNRRTFPGEGFTVPTLYSLNAKGIWVGLANDCLFTPDGYALASTADEYSRELVNFIYYYAQKGKITVKSNHPLTEQFLELFAGHLDREANFIQRVHGGSVAENCFVMWIE